MIQMIQMIQKCQNLSEILTLFQQGEINFTNMGDSFQLLDVFQFMEMGNHLYDCLVRQQMEMIDCEKVVKDLSQTFPEIRDFSNDKLFPSDKKPLYWDTYLIEVLSNYYSTKIKAGNDVEENKRKYSLVYDTVKNYWKSIKERLSPLEKQFEEINKEFEEKCKVLESYPKVVEIFELVDQIKNLAYSQVWERVEEWKKSNPFNFQNKEEIYSYIDKIYPDINESVCSSLKINDPNMRKQIMEVNGVNKGMIKFGLSLELMGSTLFSQ